MRGPVPTRSGIMKELRQRLSLLRDRIHHLRCSPGALLPALFLCLTAHAAGDTKPAVQAPLAETTLLLDAAAAGDRVIAVGQRGHILVSRNGADWQQAQVPVRALLTAVHMHDAATGWAVGHDAVILRTDDAGDTWRLAHRAPEEELPLLDVWFRDKETGFAVGAYGYFLATRDGGATWVARAISADDFHLNEIVPAGPRRLFIAAEAGVVYRSDDDGATWRETPSPYTGSWYGALALDADQLLLFGLRGHLFRSEDAGEGWTRVTTHTNATLTDAIRLQSGDVVFTGLEGIILTSRDNGRSVSAARLRSRQGITSALALPDGDVLLTGEFGVQRLSRLDPIPSSE